MYPSTAINKLVLENRSWPQRRRRRIIAFFNCNSATLPCLFSPYIVSLVGTTVLSYYLWILIKWHLTWPTAISIFQIIPPFCIHFCGLTIHLLDSMPLARGELVFLLVKICQRNSINKQVQLLDLHTFPWILMCGAGHYVRGTWHCNQSLSNYCRKNLLMISWRTQDALERPL